MQTQSLEKTNRVHETKKEKYKAQAGAYIKRLSELSSGDLAILRRCNKNPLEDQRLFSVLGKLGALNNYNFAVIACLFAVFHKAEEQPSFITNYNFGKSFREAYDPENQKQDTRFRAILMADQGDALAYRLRQAVRLIMSKDEQVDFSVLLSNLLNWESPKKWVQRKWAEGYYQGFTSPQESDAAADENDSEDEEEAED
jgi:CRISPR type I-E-associated protein CasB/Cse2